jgi:hypothetical protein
MSFRNKRKSSRHRRKNTKGGFKIIRDWFGFGNKKIVLSEYDLKTIGEERDHRIIYQKLENIHPDLLNRYHMTPKEKAIIVNLLEKEYPPRPEDQEFS